MVRRVFKSSRGYMTNVDEMPAHDPAIGETGNDARNPGFPSIEFKKPFTLSKANSCHRVQAKQSERSTLHILLQSKSAYVHCMF